MKYIVIDDEPISHKLIEKFCHDIEGMELSGNYYSALDAIPALQKDCIDLVFLDITMPKLSGFDFLDTIQSIPKIIVISGHSEFAVESYEYPITDYLLKPFNFERFYKATQKVRQQIEQEKSNESEDDFILVKDEKKRHNVNLKDIARIEAHGNYTIVHLSSSRILSQMKISDFEIQLPDEKFLRIHRSHIVSKHAITLVSGGKLHLGDFIIPIGRVYKVNVDNFLRTK
jgi:DNA-binding LytR/AlgR family response regulator